MTAEALHRPAARRQLAYLGRLQAEFGEDRLEIDGGMSSYEASQLISELMEKTGRNGVANNLCTEIAVRVEQKARMRIEPVR